MGNRDRLLALAAMQMASRGYHQFTVDALIAASGIAKSNVYYHFPSKEQLGQAVVQYWIDVYTSLDKLTLGNPALQPQRRIATYGWRLLTFDQKTGFSGDSLYALVENSGNSESDVLYKEYRDQHIQVWSKLIKIAQSNGTSSTRLEPDSTAFAVTCFVHGARDQAHLTKSDIPLQRAFAIINNLLFNKV